MTTISTLAEAIRQSRQLTSEHIYQINSMLLQRQYTETDLQALDCLIEELISHQVKSTSPVLNLFLASA